MSYSTKLKKRAVYLRKQGYSIKEIASLLNIAISTSSLWLNNVELNSRAQTILREKRILGQYKSRLTLKEKRHKKDLERWALVNELLSKIIPSKELYKLCCSLLYWCEGNKSKDTYLRFTNSDPTLIKTFLFFLRNGFKIDNSKLRILMHLHEYHKENIQKEFWHEITKIPINQFHRTYWKPHTNKRKHDNYPGCIAISYYDAEVAKEIMSIYNSLVHRGVG